MDGPIDYLHECDENVCIFRSDYVGGVANTMTRRTIVGQIANYEVRKKDADGHFTLIKTDKREIDPAESIIGLVDHSEGKAYCTDCDKTVEDYYQLVDDIVDIQANTTPLDFKHLEKDGDFYRSRVGILIHENCAAEGRWGFNFEEMLLDSMVKGMSCLADGHQIVDEERDDVGIDRESTKYSLFPQFLKHLSNESMVFCELDDYEKAVIDSMEEGEEKQGRMNNPAYAGIGSEGKIHYGNKTYNGTHMVFKKEQTVDLSENEIEALFFHEVLHNLGYAHEETIDSVISNEAVRRYFSIPDKDVFYGKMFHNDYSALCEVACFPEVYDSLLGVQEVRAARRHCMTYDITVDADRAAHRIREEIRRKYNP